MEGGPFFFLMEKKIPTFVGSSPKASITAKLLTDMLRFMDSLGLFQREEKKLMPFLLLDGHHSRFSLEFLDYIDEEASKWKVCFGVPYGTHIWQVADSPQLNGAFKTSLGHIKLAIWPGGDQMNKSSMPLT